jgi:NAD(P)-dependent dehydrogenase (short-subunit alcohol dehydrogenase family)
VSVWTTLRLLRVIDVSLLVVTGASDGIGREFAIQLARAGFNVLLAARNQAKLDAVVADIGLFDIVPFSSQKFTCTYAFACSQDIQQCANQDVRNRFCVRGRREVGGALRGTQAD